LRPRSFYWSAFLKLPVVPVKPSPMICQKYCVCGLGGIALTVVILDFVHSFTDVFNGCLCHAEADGKAGKIYWHNWGLIIFGASQRSYREISIVVRECN